VPDSLSFLLESVEGGGEVGRYSFLGCDPLVLEARESHYADAPDGSSVVFEGDPLALTYCFVSPVKLSQLPSGIGVVWVLGL